MSKHTPGPWRADEFPSGGWWISVDDSPHAGKGVGSVHRYEDAHLIAAAPDMAISLDAVNDDLDRLGYVSSGTRLLALAAIAKATNEQVRHDRREEL